MSDGPAPWLGDRTDRTAPIDDGTLARMPTPSPGPIGLEANGSPAAHSSPDMPDRIVSYARRRLGRPFLDGECFTLVDHALGAAGAKSASDYGTVVPDADYVWGTWIGLSDLQPGDVIQFRDYVCTVVTVTEDAGGTSTEEIVQERLHHTAIVERVGEDGAVTVLEQNAPEGAPVARSELFFAEGRVTSGHRVTTITVRGSFWFYRPEAR